MPSFDITSEIDMQEIRNAVDQAAREIDTRFDFKGTDDRLAAARQVLEEKLVRRKISMKCLDHGKVEQAAGGTVRQVTQLVAGINSDRARQLNKFIKELGIKGIQSQTQGEQIRVIGKKRDQLQEVIQACKEHDFDIPLQFGNFRD